LLTLLLHGNKEVKEKLRSTVVKIPVEKFKYKKLRQYLHFKDPQQLKNNPKTLSCLKCQREFRIQLLKRLVTSKKIQINRYMKLGN
jgi:hypothetical protein